jgi:very-short-patch-repair endonuclease
MTTSAVVLDTRRPFTRADAVEAGISGKTLRGSRFRRIFHGVYVDARVPDAPLLRTQAALLLHPPHAFASHFSAGRVYGVPLPDHPHEHVTVWLPEDRVFRVGIFPHATQYPTPDDVTEVRGTRVSKPCRMFVELASVLGLVDLVVVGDALIRLGLCTREQLTEYCRASPAQHAGDARRAAAYVRDRVESAMESRLRMLIVLSGLPEPEVNWEVGDDDGVALYRFDLGYVALKLAVEYDGRQHAESSYQWKRDLERREWMDRHGWRVVVVTSDGLFREPLRTILRIREALAERGQYVPSALMSEDWRPHFPTR